MKQVISTLKIFSVRHSVAKGTHVVEERLVTESTAEDWLKIYIKDDPEVCFFVSATARPKLQKR